MVKYNRKRLLKGSLASFFSLGVRVLLQLLQVPILYLAWNAEQVSAWLLLWTLPSYMALTVSSLGMAGGNIALDASRRGDLDQVRAAYRATVAAITVSNLVLAAVVALSFPYFFQNSKWTIDHDTIRWTVAFIALYVMIRVQSQSLELVYRYGEDYGAANLYESFSVLGELAVTAIVVNLTRNMVILPAALAGLRLVSYGLISQRARSSWPEVFEPAARDEMIATLRRMFMPFVGFLLSPLLYAINLQGYSLIVSAAFGPAIFATFLTIRTLARMVDQWCTLSNRLLFYELSYIDIETNPNEVIGILGAVVAVLGVGAVAYCGFLFVFGEPLHHHWTAGKVAFSPALVLVFGAAALVRSLADPVFALLSTRNAHVRVTSVYLTCSVLSVGLAWVLVHMGVGVIWVSACVVLAELSNLVACYAVAGQMLRLNALSLALRMITRGPRFISVVVAKAKGFAG